MAARLEDPRVVADIAAYQATDPDPYDQENFPEDSNPFGVQPLRDGTVLVSDAAGNDLLRVFRNGHIKTVARLKTRTVEVPEESAGRRPRGQPAPARRDPDRLGGGRHLGDRGFRRLLVRR